MKKSDTPRLSPPSRVFADVSNGRRPYALARVPGKVCVLTLSPVPFMR